MKQFKNLIGRGRRPSKKLIVICVACIWSIWKHRKYKVFLNEEIYIETIVEDAKMSAWKSLKIKSNAISMDIEMWYINPKASFGIRGD